MALDAQWKVPGNFSKNSYHLYRYFRNQCILFFALDLILYFGSWQLPTLQLSLPVMVIAVLLSVYAGLLSSVFIHNAAHDNFKPKWLNQPVGELMGLIHLYGFWGLKEGHMIHHRYPDHPVLDPHRPSEKSLLRFIFTMNRGVYYRVMYFYYRNSDLERRVAKKVWSWTTGFWLASVALKLIFWFLILGHVSFVCFYVPAAIFAWVSLAHGNFVTHQKTDDPNQFEIINLNDTVFYKFLNLILFGIYMHKNHHINAKLFNPARLKQSSSKASEQTPLQSKSS